MAYITVFNCCYKLSYLVKSNDSWTFSQWVPHNDKQPIIKRTNLALFTRLLSSIFKETYASRIRSSPMASIQVLSLPNVVELQ